MIIKEQTNKKKKKKYNSLPPCRKIAPIHSLLSALLRRESRISQVRPSTL
jgi:hypothetical protein